MKFFLCIAFLISFTGFANSCPQGLNGDNYLEMPINHNDLVLGSYCFHYKLLNSFDKNKKTLILLHGGPAVPGGMQGFEYYLMQSDSDLLSEIFNQYNIIAIDERGAGQSLLPEQFNYEFMTIEDTAADIDYLRKSLLGSEGKIALWGVSYGTTLAIVYASTYAGKVEQMIFEGSVLDGRWITEAFDNREQVFQQMLDNHFDGSESGQSAALWYQYLIKRIKAGNAPIDYDSFILIRNTVLDYSAIFSIAYFPQLINGMFWGDYSLLEETINAFFGETNNRTTSQDASNGAGYTHIACRQFVDFSIVENFAGKDDWINQICPEGLVAGKIFNAANYVSKIDIPVLLIVGEYDTAAPSKYSIELNNMLPNSKVFIVPQAGHEVLAQRGKCDIKLVKDFLFGKTFLELDSSFTEYCAPLTAANLLPVD